MYKKILISTLSITLSVYLGFRLSDLLLDSKHVANEAVSSVSQTLEEELSFPDLIIRGTVVEELTPVKRDAGIHNVKADLSYDVAPVKIKIYDTLLGEKPLEDITYLQRGTDHSGDNLKKGNDVVLMLTKTTDGFYWSYNFEDGIWQIDKDGTIDTKSNLKVFKDLKKLKIDDFSKKVNYTLKKE
jgi:hypothetical protein